MTSQTCAYRLPLLTAARRLVQTVQTGSSNVCERRVPWSGPLVETERPSAERKQKAARFFLFFPLVKISEEDWSRAEGQLTDRPPHPQPPRCNQLFRGGCRPTGRLACSKRLNLRSVECVCTAASKIARWMQLSPQLTDGGGGEGGGEAASVYRCVVLIKYWGLERARVAGWEGCGPGRGKVPDKKKKKYGVTDLGSQAAR